ncbi:MAG: DNA polymerase III subunit gamma/tau [Chitinivibrionia bacterium]|nr:DNA polymerase III subunit gamma/tau [Chitinivibrionia bacterium]MCL1947340.1 DNA polymerase III subunit gamma/tau [Chitinivibrionia bacterium]
MSYLVFARKWRPMTFDDVVGQEHITNTLKRSIATGKTAHSYIFTGTRGVGKTTTARILARALNCEKGPTPNPCGECDSCKAAINGSNFNIAEFDAASNNGVNDVKELMEAVNYVPMGNGANYRVFLIDEAHSLSKQAWNSLLKTLEEPPENVLFIFATTEPEKILPTILSRSIRFDFRPISQEAIFRQLTRICNSESIKFEDNALNLIAQKANGSMRDSLSLLEQVRSFCEGELTESDTRKILGLVSVETYCEILKLANERKIGEILQIFDKTLEDGFDISEFIDGMLSFLRMLMFLKIKGNTDKNPLYENIVENYCEGDILRISEMVSATQKELQYSSFRRFSAERLLVKIANMDKTVSIQQILDIFKKSEDGSIQSGEFEMAQEFASKIKPKELNAEIPNKTDEKTEETSQEIKKEPQEVKFEAQKKREEYAAKKTTPQKIETEKTKIKKTKESVEELMKNQPIVAKIVEKFDAKFI